MGPPDPTRLGDPRREGGPPGPLPAPDPTRLGDHRREGGCLAVHDPDPNRMTERQRAAGSLPPPDTSPLGHPLSRSFALGFDQTPWPTKC